jgi:HEAT repeat protein
MDADTTSTPKDEKGSQTDSIAELLNALASERIDNESVNHAYAAAYTLARSGAAGIEALAHVLRDWGDYGPFALHATIQALGASANALAARLLLRVVPMPPADGNFGVEHLRAQSALENLGAGGASVLADLVTTPGLPSSIIRTAAQILGSTGDEKTALGPLIAALGNRDDQNIAIGGAVGLGKLKSAAAIPALIAVLGEARPLRSIGAQGNLYTSVQGALRQIGELAIPALLQAVSSGSAVLRQRAAWTLSWMADHAQACNGLRALLEDTNAEVRAAAVSAMLNHGDPEDLPALERISREDQDAWLLGSSLAEQAQNAIISIKSRFYDRLRPPTLDDEAQAMEGFYPNWYDETPRTTASEVDRLVKDLTADNWDGEDQEPPDHAANWDEEDQERAEQAAYSLVLQGTPGLRALTAVACNRDLGWNIRATALDALAETKDEATALQPLLEALHDPEPWLSRRATSALGTLRSAAAIPHLIEALDDSSVAIYDQGAQNALVCIGQASIPALLHVLAHGPESKHKAVLQTLREMSADPRVAEAFVGALGDPDPVMRKLAIEAIAFPHEPSESESDSVRSDPAAVRDLQPLLDDPDKSVRDTAWRGLLAIGGPDDSVLLERVSRYTTTTDDAGHGRAGLATLPASDDSQAEIASHLRLLAKGATGMADARAVWQAAHALRRLGPPGINALIAILRDTDLYRHSSRVWAIDALGASGSANAVAPLLDILQGAGATLPIKKEVAAYDFLQLGEERGQFAHQLRAGYALARLGTPGLDALKAVMQNPATPAQVRWAADDALGNPHAGLRG